MTSETYMYLTACSVLLFWVIAAAICIAVLQRRASKRTRHIRELTEELNELRLLQALTPAARKPSRSRDEKYIIQESEYV